MSSLGEATALEESNTEVAGMELEDLNKLLQ